MDQIRSEDSFSAGVRYFVPSGFCICLIDYGLFYAIRPVNRIFDTCKILKKTPQDQDCAEFICDVISTN